MSDVSPIAYHPGLAYWFVSSHGDDRFLAVAAERNGNEITFVKPQALISESIATIEGRETVQFLADDGRAYFSSAAAVESVAAASRVLGGIKQRGAARL